MPALPWFRMYIEFATDPDIQSLAFEDQRHYVMVLCLKGMGVLDKDYPSDDRRAAVIRRALGLDTATAAEAKRRLMEAGLIDDEWQPHGWDKRQYESDSSTGRVQKHRDRKRFSNVSETAPDTEADTDTDAEKSQRTRKARPATRLPDDFELTDERRLVAEAEKLPAERTFAKFVDYWRAASGAKARKHDWDATWRNWCRTEADRSRGVPHGTGQTKTKFERAMEALDGS